MNRFAFSLRDGLALLLVFCFVLAAYRFGVGHGIAEAHRQIIDLDKTSADETVREFASRPEDWEKLRTIVLDRSQNWHGMSRNSLSGKGDVVH